MPLLDLMVERHDVVVKRATDMDARFYGTLERSSFAGVVFSGVGVAAVSPMCGLLTIAFGCSAIHFGNKLQDTARSGYTPSPASLEKAETLRLTRN